MDIIFHGLNLWSQQFKLLHKKKETIRNKINIINGVYYTSLEI